MGDNTCTRCGREHRSAQDVRDCVEGVGFEPRRPSTLKEVMDATQAGLASIVDPKHDHAFCPSCGKIHTPEGARKCRRMMGWDWLYREMMPRHFDHPAELEISLDAILNMEHGGGEPSRTDLPPHHCRIIDHGGGARILAYPSPTLTDAETEQILASVYGCPVEWARDVWELGT